LTLNQAELTHATKAAQNMLLLNNSCGLPANTKKLNAALNPLGASNGTAKLQIAESHKTNIEVGIAISTGSGYQIGMQPLGSNALFIKLDASSPNFDINGQAAYQKRTQTANGLNPLATMTYSVRMVKEDAGVKAVADAFWLALQSSAWSDIAGLAYIDGAEDNPTSPKQSKVQRLQNTNCSPLIVSKNTAVIKPTSFPSSTTLPVPSTPPGYNYTIAGTLSGLDAEQTLTILNIDNESITLSSDGAFIFSKPRLPGTIYSVSIKEHTSDRLCIVSQGSGTLVSNVTNVSVRCLPPVVSTLAGSGQQGSTNGTGTNASFFVPNSVAVDSLGNVFVADTLNHQIRKINSSGVVTTFAGNGQQGSANGTGIGASFNGPRAISVDSSGNVYVADDLNNLIRKIKPSGLVTTLAGSGQLSSVNGTGTDASFNRPRGITVDKSGNLFVADSYNHLIRKITFLKP
jgi:hypothetical protein